MNRIKFDENLKLDDGSPLYHALLEEKSPLYIKKDESINARQVYNDLCLNQPDLLRELSGKTYEEARGILKEFKILD
mgnify:CR=1 FL=1